MSEFENIMIAVDGKEYAALRKIVEAVAGASGWWDSDGPCVCMFCTNSDDRYSIDWDLTHRLDCPVTKARELLGKSSEEVQ